MCSQMRFVHPLAHFFKASAAFLQTARSVVKLNEWTNATSSNLSKRWQAWDRLLKMTLGRSSRTHSSMFRLLRIREIVTSVNRARLQKHLCLNREDLKGQDLARCHQRQPQSWAAPRGLQRSEGRRTSAAASVGWRAVTLWAPWAASQSISPSSMPACTAGTETPLSKTPSVCTLSLH
jgi:hypothetical protein